MTYIMEGGQTVALVSTPTIIGGTLILGLLIPLALLFRPITARNGVLLSSVLILVGGFIMRTVIVMGGQGLM